MRGYDITDEDIEAAASELDDTFIPVDLDGELLGDDDDLYNVTCRTGCGIFSIKDVEMVELDLENGRATFRCRACNELQNAEILILD
jgi:hypothetical protein